MDALNVVRCRCIKPSSTAKQIMMYDMYQCFYSIKEAPLKMPYFGAQDCKNVFCTIKTDALEGIFPKFEGLFQVSMWERAYKAFGEGNPFNKSFTGD